MQVVKGDKHTFEAQTPVDITNEISIKPKNGAGAAVLAAKRAAK